MSSIFSFMKPDEEAPDEEPAPEPTADEEPPAEPASVEAAATSEAPTPALAEAFSAPNHEANSASTMDQALAVMLATLDRYLALVTKLAVLDRYLPEPEEPLPAPGISIVHIVRVDGAVQPTNGASTRLYEAVVRFQLWSDTRPRVDTALNRLRRRLGRVERRPGDAGLLSFAFISTSQAEEVEPNRWRRTADYRVRFRSTASVSAVSVTERPLGVGNRRGMERFGSFFAIELKGLRLDAVVRFQFLADELGAVEAAVEALQTRLLADKDKLWSEGFLRLGLRETSLAEHVSSLDVWRKTTDYEVLFEFRYADTDGAESLIARIPIDIDSEYDESTVVTDEMVRWDKESALDLEVRGGSRRIHRVGSVTILAHLAEDWNGSRVTLRASVGGAVRERTFADVRQFRDAFDLERENVAEEGEEPEIKIVQLGQKPYVAGRMVFPNADFPDPLVLKGGEDIFNIRYDHERFRPDNQGETDSVVYLRVLN